jgi:molybdate transport system substrate-binding protein
VLSLPGQSKAAEIRVATASNFRNAMSELVRVYEHETGQRVVAVYGSTGKHYAQIINGAPFEAFFAADARRPERLEEDGYALPGSRFTYATGKLVLWSPQPGYVDEKGHILKQAGFRHLAMANPRLAPYGAAAREVLESFGLWLKLGPKLVMGENIGQAFLFVQSRNAELGFVAWSQLVSNSSTAQGSFWRVPENLYRPIEQQAVLLKDSEASRTFMSFIRGQEAAKIIQAHGYATTVELP